MLFLGARVPLVFAWDNHDQITKEAFVNGFSDLHESLDFEPIDLVLKNLQIKGKIPSTRDELCELLNIHCDKIAWSVSVPHPTGLSVLMEAVMEADRGMDQDLFISQDQEYMGGFSGLSSQAIRHMYYEAFDFESPLSTFHFPFKQLGFAHERAQTYFDLAIQAKQGQHLYWAYRFLGYGLHYVQDLTQPYHANQFSSFRLLALKTLIQKGWKDFILETTRIVSNFHLSFEDYVDLIFSHKIKGTEEVLVAVRVPVGDAELKVKLEQDAQLSVSEAAILIAKTSNRLASDLVLSQIGLYGETLFSAEVNYLKQQKINLLEVPETKEAAGAQEALFHQTRLAISNTGVATRWYVEKFLQK